MREIEALVESVTADDQVFFVRVVVGVQAIVGADDVAAAELERVDVEAFGEHVHGRFDAEHHLTESVAAVGAGGDVVRVDDLGVDAAVRHAVHGRRLGDAVEHHADGVVAVRAGVAQDIEAHRGERAVGVRAEGDPHAHRMPERGARELLGARELVGHGPAGAEDGEHHEVFGEDLLLAAEAAADARGEDAHALARHVEDVGEFVAREEGHLGGGADDDTSVVVEPADARMGLELRVRDARGLPFARDDGGARGEGGVDVAGGVVHRGDHVAVCLGHAVFGGAIGVEERGTGRARLVRLEHRREHVVLDADEAGCGIRCRGGLGDDGGDALSDVADDVVEDAGVVGVVFAMFVAACGEPGGGGVFVGEDGDDARDGEGRRGVDQDDAGVGVRGADDAQDKGVDGRPGEAGVLVSAGV